MHIKTSIFDMENIITKIAFASAKHLESNNASNDVILTKNNNSRDVVTSLDYLLNESIKDIIKEDMPDALVLSEEDSIDQNLSYFKDLTFVIDPLDGSQNFSIGFPFYSSVVAAIEDNKIIASAVVSSFNKQLVIWDKNTGLKSNINNEIFERGLPSYLAYSPIKTSANDNFIFKLITNIDEYSSGIYRWGSASNGLLELLNGRFQTFVAYEIRIWDCLAFLPILLEKEIHVAFAINNFSISLIASSNIEHFNSLKKIYKSSNINLINYNSIDVGIINE
jgi:myo-inositol-1(or 4)-monophosphatase